MSHVSEVIFGTPASTRDPARFAFAHETVRVRGPSSQRWLVASLRDATGRHAVSRRSGHVRPDDRDAASRHGKVDRSDKVDALERLSRFAKTTEPDQWAAGSGQQAVDRSSE
jgi:hypothetical protein